MKRFYTEVSVAAAVGGFAIRLDGRGVKTPERAPLLLPNASLAEAIADEWRAQGEEIDPRAMPLTCLANAAIDRIAADHDRFVRDIAVYVEHDERGVPPRVLARHPTIHVTRSPGRAGWSEAVFEFVGALRHGHGSRVVILLHAALPRLWRFAEPQDAPLDVPAAR